MSTEMTLRLDALDTLFFRESRPMEAIGGSELGSLFPPPPRTVLGAVRTAIGDALGADWTSFKHEAKKYLLPDGRLLHDLIGYGDDLGVLSLVGVWPSLNGERLYPAPLLLLQQKGQISPARLRIGAAVRSHIGMARLPEPPESKKGYRSLEQAWLTRTGMEAVLCGDVPERICRQSDLFAEEPRLGIARNNALRTVEKSLLYQTRHLRPRAGLSIEADIAGLGKSDIGNRIVRLGGEGRMASLTMAGRPGLPNKPTVKRETRGVIIVLLTPARFENRHGNWLSPGFAPDKVDGADVWQGRINGIPLTLHAAVLGKAQREGGWDMAERKPRAVQSLIPAGSCYYCTVDDGDIRAAIKALHGHRTGEDQKLGRGLIACGLWNENEFAVQRMGD